MEPSNKPNPLPLRFLAMFLTLTIAAAACGSDSDRGTEDTTEEDTTEEDTETVAPNWATSPQAVRDLKNPTGVAGSAEEPNPCAFRPGVIAVYDAPDLQEYTPYLGNVWESVGDIDEQMAQIFVTLYESENPISDSVELRDQGILASPVYLMFPAPGRMFFPGTLPVPSADGGAASENPEDYPDQIEVSVAVVDTGGWGDMQGQTNREADDLDPPFQVDSQIVIDDPWTFGHGAFVGDIIHRNGGATAVHYRVRQSGGSFDEGFVDEQFARIAIDGINIINLSLGTFPCYVNGEPLEPVITLASAATRLDEGSVIVAAAGNSNDDRLTMPAAFAAGRASWNLSSQDSSSQLDPLVETLRASGPQIIAVGAVAAPNGEEYSTTGSWVSEYREGCHSAAHPGGIIRYPQSPVDEGNPVDVELTDFAYWCGSSFAAPVVTAEIAASSGGE